MVKKAPQPEPETSAAEAAEAPSAREQEGAQADALAEKETKIAALQQELLYQRAEFDNFRKRTEKRYRDALEFATEPLMKDLLPVVDNLDRALAHAKDSGAGGLDALTEGVGHVFTQFRQVLENHGIVDVPARGEKFDPNVHESLAQVPGDEDNRVVEVYQNGYLLKGRLLRPAKVVISKVATPGGDD